MQFTRDIWLIYIFVIFLCFLFIVIAGIQQEPRQARYAWKKCKLFLQSQENLGTLIKLLILEEVIYASRKTQCPCDLSAQEVSIWAHIWQQGLKTFDLRSRHWASGRYLTNMGDRLRDAHSHLPVLLNDALLIISMQRFDR